LRFVRVLKPLVVAAALIGRASLAAAQIPTPPPMPELLARALKR
jgi:hypothetical protein